MHVDKDNCQVIIGEQNYKITASYYYSVTYILYLHQMLSVQSHTIVFQILAPTYKGTLVHAA